MKKNSNWNEQEKKYGSLRDKALSKIDAKSVSEAPFVYAQRQTVTKALTRIDLFKHILETQGAIVECGVHNGSSLFLYDHLSSILEPYNMHRKIIGFDTFEGFKSLSNKDASNVTPDIFNDVSFDHLIEWTELQKMNRSVSHIEKVELVKGDACETIPKFVDENPHLIIALLYLDFDIYEPTKTALEHLLPLVPKGGIVAFDELNQKKWPGETVALKEAISINKIKLQRMSYDPWPSYYIVE